MPKKFDQDAKDRVVRLVEDRILAENLSLQAACQAVTPKLGVLWHSARQWVQQARRDGECPFVCVQGRGLHVVGDSVGVGHC